jgi:hypothetical protein
MNPKAARTPHLIALANEPRMLREMLHRALDNTPGVIVVEQSSDLQRLVDIFQQVQMDWLVVTLDEEERLPRQAFLLLNRIPSLSLLAISMDGSHIEVHIKTPEHRVLRYVLEEITLTTLISILRYKLGDWHLPIALSATHCARWPVDPSEVEAYNPGWRRGRPFRNGTDENST